MTTEAVLESIVNETEYRKGWTVEFFDDYDRGQDCVGPTVVITTNTVNSYRQENYVAVRHLFGVPGAAYNERSWRRWLFNCFQQVEAHECAEFFTVNGEKPYAPHHGPGEDPYTVFERGTELEVATAFTGKVNE